MWPTASYGLHKTLFVGLWASFEILCGQSASTDQLQSTPNSVPDRAKIRYAVSLRSPHTPTTKHYSKFIRAATLAAVSALERACDGPAEREPCRVLLVEDDADLAKIILATLERAGTQVHHAST